MKKFFLVCFLCFQILFGFSNDIQIDLPEYIVADIPLDITISGEFAGTTNILVDGKLEHLAFHNGTATFTKTFSLTDESIQIQIEDFTFRESISPMPLWYSILPPLLAIFLALITREVLTSLFIGIFSGAAILGFYKWGVVGIFTGFLNVIDVYMINALNNWGHISVIFFSMIIGSIVAVISKNGGMNGVVNHISKFAKDAKSGQFATWGMGLAIFFDDYANSLVVGNTLRPVTDKLKISREKLAYIVDSTAAPIASIAFVSTWIGAELGYIEDGIKSIADFPSQYSPYSIFLNSITYSFYPILAIVFIAFLIWKNKDFGPMLKAEKSARAGRQLGASTKSVENEEFEMKEGIEPKAFLAIVPISVIIIGTITGLMYTGWDSAVWQNENFGFFKKLSITIGQSDSYFALLWSSISALTVAVLMSISVGKLKLTETMDSVMTGLKAMLTAIVILILAWSLAEVTESMHTADFLTSSLDGYISPYLLPAGTFIIAALISFSTGSSWGTMAILYPLMLPASWLISINSGMDVASALPIFFNVVSCVLAGSVLGDHCSPISDTTILSSLASSCNHIQHVKTQMPYALTVGGVSVFMGTLLASFGISTWILFPVCIAALWLIVHFFGKEVKVK